MLAGIKLARKYVPKTRFPPGIVQCLQLDPVNSKSQGQRKMVGINEVKISSKLL